MSWIPEEALGQGPPGYQAAGQLTLLPGAIPHAGVGPGQFALCLDRPPSRAGWGGGSSVPTDKSRGLSVAGVGLGPWRKDSLLLCVRREALGREGGRLRRPPDTATCALPVACSRYSPHQDADPLKPREPAIIKHFTAYKNQDHGAWLRGGDVWLDSCR